VNFDRKLLVWLSLRLVLTSVLMLAVFGLTGALAESSEPSDFQHGKITLTVARDGKIKSMTMPVEFAITDEQRRFGLMYRDSLPDGHGMLFVFPEEAVRSFWMKNTAIPLDIIFFDNAGHFVSMIENAAPFSLIARRSKAPARYVLEVNGGAARRFGIDPRSVLSVPSIP